MEEGVMDGKAKAWKEGRVPADHLGAWQRLGGEIQGDSAGA